MEALDVLTNDHRLIGQLEEGPFTNTSLVNALVAQALAGKSVSTLFPSLDNASWVLSVAVPVLGRNKIPVGALLAEQSIDDVFAQTLVARTGSNVLLCEQHHVLASTMRWFSFDQFLPETTLCTTNQFNHINGSEQLLTLAKIVPTENQLANSPSLVIVDIRAALSCRYPH